MTNAHKLSLENLKIKEHSGDKAANRRIILKRILKKHGLRAWTGPVGSEYGPVTSSCKQGNEHSTFIKGGLYHNQVIDYCIFSRRILPHGVSYKTPF
jgi:hypothetical protein